EASVPFGTIFTGMMLVQLFYWGTNQAIIQRALGAKNLKEGVELGRDSIDSQKALNKIQSLAKITKKI
ncbi:MAG: hypothetical protein HN625_03665, partial [Flavobacteriaceae bacterium]|nr:hypothetical protein [Flavobacteriaceae bacterium]